MEINKPLSNSPDWKKKLYEIIFEADTKDGKLFDIILLWIILASVLAVFLESMANIRQDYGDVLVLFEWAFTILFTIEYLFRLICVKRAIVYARSFFGIVDLLAILPTYLSLFIVGGQYLLVIRILRLLRVVRIFKLTHFLHQADVLKQAMKASRIKITVFILTVLSLVVIIGSLMYVIEGPPNGFTSIPISVYWAIVTLTTVGYGDISPNTPMGQLLASVVMIIGYAIIAVPTGIVTVELAEAVKRSAGSIRICSKCRKEGHDKDANFCNNCGNRLDNVIK